MNYTENYHLPQWEENDRVMRSDFNNAMAALEDGLSTAQSAADRAFTPEKMPYATGFYYGAPGQYYENSRYIRDWQVTAVVVECDGEGNATLSLRNKFRAGDEVELVGPDLRPFSMIAPEMRSEAGEILEEPRTPRMRLRVKLPQAVPPMTLVRRGVDLSAK